MNPDYTSLNLAQAVLLFSWEWWKHQLPSQSKDESGTEEHSSTIEAQWTPVPKEELHHFMQRLESQLDNAGFFQNPAKKADMLQKLRTLLNRTNPTSQEIRSLQGILSALSK